MRSSPAAYLRCNTLIIVAGWQDLVRTRLSVTTIPSGCDRSIMSSSSIALTLRVEQGFSQCVLTFKYIHLGHCLLPVLAFIHICSGVALDEMPLVTAPTLTVGLLSSRATPTSTTTTRELPTTVRPAFMISGLSSTFIVSLGMGTCTGNVGAKGWYAQV